MKTRTRNAVGTVLVASALAFSCSATLKEDIAKTPQAAPQAEAKVTCLKPSEMPSEKVKAAFDAVKSLLLDTDPKVQEGLEAIIMKLGPATVPYLVEAGNYDSAWVYGRVAHLLGLLGDLSTIPKIESIRNVAKRDNTAWDAAHGHPNRESQVHDTDLAIQESTNAIKLILARAKQCNAVEVPVPKAEPAKSAGPVKAPEPVKSAEPAKSSNPASSNSGRPRTRSQD